jgi:hypothetical protein
MEQYLYLVTINKKQSLLIEIALVLLFTGIALATSINLSASSSDVVIYAFDQNPAGSDKGNEWVTLYNPSNERVDIGSGHRKLGFRNCRWRKGNYP